MHLFCPATGHVLEEQAITRALALTFCPQHGVRLFQSCSACGAPWTGVVSRQRTARSRLTARSSTDNPLSEVDKGASFCSTCGLPAPWLARSDLIQWLQHRVQASSDVPASTRQELHAMLDRLRDMDAADTRTIPGWQRLRDAAPKVWEASKPVRDALIGEAVKKALGL
jgi:hypothetical protein